MLMPLIWMMRGLPSEKTVPATERSCLSVDDGQTDVALVGAALSRADLFDRMPRSLREGRRGDHVDVCSMRLQEAGERGRGQRARVHLGDIAFIFDARSP